MSCNYGQECSMDKHGITECICPKSCEPIVRPVCATDGKTYDNLCEMMRSACNQRLNITAKYIGVCGKIITVSFWLPFFDLNLSMGKIVRSFLTKQIFFQFFTLKWVCAKKQGLTSVVMNLLEKIFKKNSNNMIYTEDKESMCWGLVSG